MTSNQAPKDPARAAALHLIAAVYGGQMIATARLDPGFAKLPGEVQARALRLTDQVLRGTSRVDKLWQPLVRRQPAPRIAAALRLGLIEVLALGAPDYAVVGDMVAAIKAHPKTRPASGLVNAVLRKALKSAPPWDQLPAAKMSQALAKKIRHAWGNDACQAIVAQWAKGQVPLDLCVKSNADEWAERLGGAVLPNGGIRLPSGQQVSALPGFSEGAFWVQDAAAQMAVQIASIQPDDNVVDLCAAPGGKTMQLAALGAQVTAVDISAARLQRLKENLARTGLEAHVIPEDVLNYHTSGFDAVVLDAPCSATGTLRRHPELPALFNTRNLSALTDIQAKMLDHAATLLRQGGRLVYVTCSILPEEGEAQIKGFLSRHAGFRALPLKAGYDATFLHRSPPYLRSLPCDWAEMGGMDGFFIAVLEKLRQ